jgi:hypothetical protein
MTQEHPFDRIVRDQRQADKRARQFRTRIAAKDASDMELIEALSFFIEFPTTDPSGRARLILLRRCGDIAAVLLLDTAGRLPIGLARAIERRLQPIGYRGERMDSI